MKYFQNRSFIEIERKFYLTICVSIVTIGLIFIAFPSSLLNSSLVDDLVNLVKAHWPKMDLEYRILHTRNAFTASRYVLSNVASCVFYFFTTLFLLFLTRKKMPFGDTVPSYITKSNIVIFPILILFLGYFAIFDLWVATTGTRVSNQIFGSLASVFWPPLLFGTLAIALFRARGLYIAVMKGKLS